MAGTAHCTHEDSWFDRSICPEPCGRMHYYCANPNCGELLDPCALFDETQPQPCILCKQESATTTCGVPGHPCDLCGGCRLSLDGLEYDKSPAEGMPQSPRSPGST